MFIYSLCIEYIFSNTYGLACRSQVLGSVVTDCCELSCGCLGHTPGPLWVQEALCTAEPSHHLLTGSFQSSRLDYLVTFFHLQKPLQPFFPNTVKVHPSLFTETVFPSQVPKISWEFHVVLCFSPYCVSVPVLPSMNVCVHVRPSAFLCIWYMHTLTCTSTWLIISAYGVNIASISLHLIFRDSVSQWIRNSYICTWFWEF